MRQGFNVDDSDTYVNPAADVLDRYVVSADFLSQGIFL